MKIFTLLSFIIISLISAQEKASVKAKSGANMSSYPTIVLAGGCFWGVEELFRSFEGVVATEVGYAGGAEGSAKYAQVSTGTTDHAESIKITYDPSKSSLEDLLQFFYKIHDPTTLNQQGNDKGKQYRSAIFYQNDEQRRVAEKVMASDVVKNRWKKPITTTLEEYKGFYSAEEYHQDYLQKNPGGYTCHWVRE